MKAKNAKAALLHDVMRDAINKSRNINPGERVFQMISYMKLLTSAGCSNGILAVKWMAESIEESLPADFMFSDRILPAATYLSLGYGTEDLTTILTARYWLHDPQGEDALMYCILIASLIKIPYMVWSSYGIETYLMTFLTDDAVKRYEEYKKNYDEMEKKYNSRFYNGSGTVSEREQFLHEIYQDVVNKNRNIEPGERTFQLIHYMKMLQWTARHEGVLAMETMAEIIEKSLPAEFMFSGMILPAVEAMIFADSVENQAEVFSIRYWVNDPQGENALMFYIMITALMEIYRKVDSYAELEDYLTVYLTDTAAKKYEECKKDIDDAEMEKLYKNYFHNND